MAKKKTSTSTPPPKRPDKYEDKLVINGTFADVIKVSVAGNPAPHPKPVKPPKKAAKKK